MQPAPRADEYRVRLDTFEGPLDLLLFLIQRAEVDVTDIPVALITRQYLEFLQPLESIDIESAGEFLVMAATLAEIKSRMLSPRPRGEGDAAILESKPEPGEDPRAELVRTLLAYRRYRTAGDALAERRRLWLERAPARAALDHAGLRAALDANLDAVEVEDADVMLLVEAFQRISEAVDFNRLGIHRVVDDDTPLELHAQDVLDQLSRRDGAPLALRDILAGRTRGEMIGLFLAILELVRQRTIRVRQDEPGIVVEAAPPEPR